MAHTAQGALVFWIQNNPSISVFAGAMSSEEQKLCESYILGNLYVGPLA
jgi:hypothetical protein